MDVGDIINLILVAGLVGLTAYYAWQTKKLVKEQKLARRDDPELLIYVADPTEHEWKKDISKVEQENRPQSKYLRVKVLLINPGITPIVLENFSETFESANRQVDIKGRFIDPKIRSSERYGLYIFAIPWVTIHDDFSILYRIYELDEAGEIEYRIKLTFNYRVGNKQRSAIKELNLKSHNP